MIRTTTRRTVPCRLAKDETGVSAVEFALVLPVLLVIYLGGVELSHAITVDRKVTAAASAVGDLVAQATEIDGAEMQNIFNAATALLVPYTSSTLKLVVTSISVTSRGDKVLASCGFHTGARSKGSTVSLPADVRIEDTTLIMAEAEYTYVPTLGQIFAQSFDMSDTFYLRPRATDAISISC
jgi:Flp pilus assembly protein TadG